MNLIDLHCDTAYRIHEEKLAFEDDRLQISSRRLHAFDAISQVFAIWCDKKLSDQVLKDAEVRVLLAVMVTIQSGTFFPLSYEYITIPPEISLMSDVDGREVGIVNV